jgi:hypothetical protein
MTKIILRSALVVLAALQLAPRGEARAQTAKPVGTAPATLPLKYTGKATSAAITPSDLMTRLYIFADDSMMGRRTGTAGGLKGTAYIEREVRRLGLKPAGDSGTYFQKVPLVRRVLDPASSMRIDTTPLKLGTEVFASVSGSGPVRPIEGAQIIYGGTPADTANFIKPDQASGKIILITGSARGLSRRLPAAVGFIVPILDQQVPIVRAQLADPPTVLQTDEPSAASPSTIYVPLSKIPQFLGIPLDSVRPGSLGKVLHGELRFTYPEAAARNVVAILPGTDPKLRNQYIAIGAHNDHLGIRRSGGVDTDSLHEYNKLYERAYVAKTGQGTEFPGSGLSREEAAAIKVNVDSLHRLRPARLDSIYNGADDDGSGSVGVLEVAEWFAKTPVKPKRSIVFVWHAGEELGLFGSQYFTDHPTVPRDSIVAQLNVDMIGRGGAADVPGGGPNYVELIGSRRLSTELGDLVEQVNKTKGYNLTFDYAFDAPGHPEQIFCRSDHYEYARYGIPITFFTTGGHSDYHQVTDEPQYIDYPHLAKVSRFIGDVAATLANLDHRIVVDKPKPDPKGACVQ